MLPCSEVHWRILPAISRELAECLKKENVPRSKIASALGTTSAAISQYMSGKRGGMKLDRDVKEACCALAKRIAKNEVQGSELNFEIAKIIAVAKKSKLGENDPCIACMSIE